MLLLSGDHLARLLEKLRKKYDCIVIDSSPLLGNAEARLLASLVDKVLFVVKWGGTPVEVTQSALSVLRNPGGPEGDHIGLVSAVITRVDLKKHSLYRYGDVADSYAQIEKDLAHFEEAENAEK